jgi:hypothetical protein
MNNNSSSLSSTLAPTSQSSKLSMTQNKNKDTVVDDIITINEKINLTKHQHHVLKIICDTYEISFSDYLQQALVEAMRFDIEEGNFCDALLEKIGGEDNKKDDSSSHLSPPPTPDIPDLMKSDLDLLKRMQTETL